MSKNIKSADYVEVNVSVLIDKYYMGDGWKEDYIETVQSQLENDTNGGIVDWTFGKVNLISKKDKRIKAYQADTIKDYEEHRNSCPHCGKRIDEDNQ